MLTKSVLLFLVWIGITNSLEIQELVVGALISLTIASLFTKKSDSFDLIATLRSYIGFAPTFLVELVKSNIEVAKIVLSKKIEIDSKVVELHTNLSLNHQKLLLANSITLTPGTLTLNVKGDSLSVHILNTKGRSSTELQKDVVDRFEQKINYIK